MYKINDVIVSGEHILNYKDKWMPVNLHPEKELINEYNEPYIYCLNTSSKEININNVIFTDWDELYDNKLQNILDINVNINEKIETKERIHLFLDKGFKKGAIVLKDNVPTPIENIKIGDKLGNDIVYGIVHIKNNDTYLGNNINIIEKTKIEIIKQRDSKHLESISQNKSTTESDILFHLLTFSKKFTVNGEVIGDYNSLIDLHS